MSVNRNSYISYPIAAQFGNPPVYPPPVADLYNTIPWDIWLYLARFLQLSDQVSLALTCKVLKTLFSQSLHRLRSNRQQKLLFLKRLDCNLPDHRLCSACHKFHRRNRKDERSWICTQPRNSCGEFGIPLIRGLYINWPSIQMALRARRYGSLKYGISLDGLPERLESTHDEVENIKWQHALHFFFSEGRFMLALDSFRQFHGDTRTLSQFSRGHFIDVVPDTDNRTSLHVRRLIDASAEDAWTDPRQRGWYPAPKNAHSWYFWSTAYWDPEAGLPGLHWTELSEERRAFGIPEWSNWRYDNRTGRPIDPHKPLLQHTEKPSPLPLIPL